MTTCEVGQDVFPANLRLRSYQRLLTKTDSNSPREPYRGVRKPVQHSSNLAQIARELGINRAEAANPNPFISGSAHQLQRWAPWSGHSCARWLM